MQGDDPCPDSPKAGLALFLFDLRKPLHANWITRPGVRLRETALALRPGSELRVYTVAAQRAAPLTRVERLCKPTARAQTPESDPPSSCDAWLLAADVDHRHALFCQRLGALQSRIDQLAAQLPAEPLQSALLIEAIEEARIELADHAGPRSFHVFSDMMQHAAWYSHLDTAPQNWDFQAFDQRRRKQVSPPVATHAASAFPTQVFYVPRHGSTASATERAAHQVFWREYFTAAGMSVAFHDEPTMPAYAAIPHAESLGSLARLAAERERLRRAHATHQSTLARVETARSDLAQARRQAAGERRESALRLVELQDEEARERQLVASARAEIARLTAAIRARRSDLAR